MALYLIIRILKCTYYKKERKTIKMEELNKEYFERKLELNKEKRGKIEKKWLLYDIADKEKWERKELYAHKNTKSKFHKYGQSLMSFENKTKEVEWAKEKSLRDLIKIQNERETKVKDIMKVYRRNIENNNEDLLL